MTKNEVKALIREKMESAENNSDESLIKKDFEDAEYYQGVRRGLMEAMKIIEMLDNDQNRT